MFGLRVYDLQIKQGSTGRKPLEFNDPLGDGISARSRLLDGARRLAGLGAIAKVPNTKWPRDFDENLPATEGDPQTTFLAPDGGSNSPELPDVEPWDYDAAGANHLFLKVEFGFVGAFLNARDATSALAISDRAATGVFRVLALLPSAGTHGRLVVETNGRTSPLVPVTSLLAWSGFLSARADDPEVRGDRWLRLRTEQMADRAALRKMAGEAESVEVLLSRKQPKMPGGNHGDLITLTVKVKEQSRREDAIVRALSWVGGEDPGEYVSHLEQIAGLDPEDLEQANLKFNQGLLEIVDKDGKRKKIDPENIRARFTYPLSELQLDDTAWIHRVQSLVTGDLVGGTEIQF